jgi:hypothetical protein
MSVKQGFGFGVGCIFAVPAVCLAGLLLLLLISPTLSVRLHARDVYALDAAGRATAVRCFHCGGSGMSNGQVCVLCEGSGISHPSPPWRVQIVPDTEAISYDSLPSWH